MQILAIAGLWLWLCALQRIPNQGAHTREDLFSIAFDRLTRHRAVAGVEVEDQAEVFVQSLPPISHLAVGLVRGEVLGETFDKTVVDALGHLPRHAGEAVDRSRHRSPLFAGDLRQVAAALLGVVHAIIAPMPTMTTAMTAMTAMTVSEVRPASEPPEEADRAGIAGQISEGFPVGAVVAGGGRCRRGGG